MLRSWFKALMKPERKQAYPVYLTLYCPFNEIRVLWFFDSCRHTTDMYHEM